MHEADTVLLSILAMVCSVPSPNAHNALAVWRIFATMGSVFSHLCVFARSQALSTVFLWHFPLSQRQSFRYGCSLKYARPHACDNSVLYVAKLRSDAGVCMLNERMTARDEARTFLTTVMFRCLS